MLKNRKFQASVLQYWRCRTMVWNFQFFNTKHWKLSAVSNIANPSVFSLADTVQYKSTSLLRRYSMCPVYPRPSLGLSCEFTRPSLSVTRENLHHHPRGSPAGLSNRVSSCGSEHTESELSSRVPPAEYYQCFLLQSLLLQMDLLND